MEAGRSLKDQELFYASIEGKHAAWDDHVNPRQNAYVGIGVMFYHFNKQAQNRFFEGYNNASRKISSSNKARRAGTTVWR